MLKTLCHSFKLLPLTLSSWRQPSIQKNSIWRRSNKLHSGQFYQFSCKIVIFIFPFLKSWVCTEEYWQKRYSINVYMGQFHLNTHAKLNLHFLSSLWPSYLTSKYQTFELQRNSTDTKYPLNCMLDVGEIDHVAFKSVDLWRFFLIWHRAFCVNLGHIFKLCAQVKFGIIHWWNRMASFLPNIVNGHTKLIP